MDRYDAVLVGAGIMSSTLASLLHALTQAAPAVGGAAGGACAGEQCGGEQCRHRPCGQLRTQLHTAVRRTVATVKALSINAAFERSLEFWASLAETGQLDSQLSTSAA